MKKKKNEKIKKQNNMNVDKSVGNKIKSWFNANILKKNNN